jgi:hypothetical protein
LFEQVFDSIRKSKEFVSLFLEQVFDFVQELKEFLRLPVPVERFLMLEPGLPYLHPRGIMPVTVAIGLVSADPGAVFFVLLPAGLAKTVWSGKPGAFLGLRIYMSPALRAFHHAPGTLKNLPQGFDLALADRRLALRPELIGFLVELDDIGHFAPHFLAVLRRV